MGAVILAEPEFSLAKRTPGINVVLRSESQQTKLAAFKGEKFLFDRQAAAVSREFAVGSDYAMARNDDGNGIRTVGEADGAWRIGIADAASEFSVGDGFTVGDFAEFFPNLLLEQRAFRRQQEIKVFKFSGEVGAELADGFGETGRIFDPVRTRGCWRAIFRKCDFAKPFTVCGEQERSDRRREMSEEHGSDGGDLLAALALNLDEDIHQGNGGVGDAGDAAGVGDGAGANFG